MSIGETLAVARQRAGMSLAQVSERTRIRESIIRGIERGDYSACGGDFYARGHIRAIAKVVGADAEPLIEEYDALHRAPDVASVVSLEELLATSAQAPPRRRPGPAAARGLAASAGVAARRWVNLSAAREQALRAAHAAGRRLSWPAVLGLALVIAAAGFGVSRILSGSSPPASQAAPLVSAQTGRAYHHPGPGQAVKSSHAAVAASPAPAVPGRALTPRTRRAVRPMPRRYSVHLYADRQSPRGHLAHHRPRRHHGPGHGHRPAGMRGRRHVHQHRRSPAHGHGLMHGHGHANGHQPHGHRPPGHGHDRPGHRARR